MRRFVSCTRCSSSLARLLGGLVVAVGLASTINAQIPGRNVNMVSGNEWPGGDPFLQRQNEPTIGASTRNPLHLLGGSNDYRTVDLPGMPGEETGDAWLGLYKSFDGGHRWTSTLLPGYPQDQSPEGLASPIKGYQAGADAVVRAGTSGLMFYSGLAFDRGENARSAIFVSRFLDQNDREAGDPFAYLGTTIVASSNGADGRFLDKPWMAVDLTRPGAPGKCNILVPSRPPAAPRMERLLAGNVYIVYTSITGNGPTLRSQIFIHTSQDCGVTWTRPTLVSIGDSRVNQGATIAIDPTDGDVFVTWRRFGLAAGERDGIMVARLPHNAKQVYPVEWARQFPTGTKAFERGDDVFEHRDRYLADVGDVDDFDQGTTQFSFRSNAYPTATVDHTGRLYVAWSERGFSALRPNQQEGDARIVIATSMDGRTFTPPTLVAEDNHLGHQLMPTITYAGGRLMLVYYDLRETRAQIFGPYISDQGLQIRQTMDIRASMGTPGVPPEFLPSVRVSDYLMGFRGESDELRPLQVNPPNLPMFKQGTVPFIGDYIDVTAAPAFVPNGNGGWAYNHAASDTPPVFHAVWTDNRDVRPPLNGDWTVYTPPTSAAVGVSSLADPTRTPPICQPGNAGSRNQNIYSARLTGGLVVGSPGNSKQLSRTLQRAFVVFAQNATSQRRTFRMTIGAQPPAGRASFNQFPLPPYTAQSPAPLTSVDMIVPPKSMASRSVYVTSSDPHAKIPVTVFEIAAPGAPGALPGGLSARTVINPDIENPDIENPDIENPDIENPDIENAEVYNPDIENPDIENPDIENPDIENPDIENPDIENVIVANPDIENVTIGNPDIENPDIENPDIENPDIENPDIENGSLTDITWKVTNTGNTTAAFNVNLFLSQSNVPGGVHTQLVVYKTYRTPVTVANGCDLRYETRNVLVTNVPSPVFITPSDSGIPDPNDPSEKNATLWLGPGEVGRITLRIDDPDASNNVLVENAKGELVSVDPAFNPDTTTITPGVAAQGVETAKAVAGVVDPPIVTPTGTNLFFLQEPVNVMEDQYIDPPVRVQARDNTAAVLAGVQVTLTFATYPGEPGISGNIAITGVDGIATFPLLQISEPGAGFRLLATVTSGSVPASAVSAPFNVGSPFSPTVVTNTNNSGPGSLRNAILLSNDLDGVQTISFNIPGDSLPFVIEPLTPLPSLFSPVIIDGTTQPGYSGEPVIVVSGGGLESADANGFVLLGGSSTIRGLVINNFESYDYSYGNAILVLSGGNVIAGNHIGTDYGGTQPASMLTYTGIKVHEGNNQIGGTSPADRNVIAGNYQGIWQVGGIGNYIVGNDIGFNRHHPVPIQAHLGQFGNQYGILIDNGLQTMVGGPDSGAGNQINSNITGIQLAGGTNTQILGNLIGTDLGSNSWPNGDGINSYGPVSGTVIGGPASERNYISNNHGWGINLDSIGAGSSGDPLITNNYIGVGLLGEPAGNLLGGIRLIDTENAMVGYSYPNIIGSNGGPGVYVAGDSETDPEIFGNYIGLSPDGLSARGNYQEGIYLDAPAQLTNNTISGNGSVELGQGTGILVTRDAAGTTIYNNWIGTTAPGDAPLPNGYSGITLFSAHEVEIGGGGVLGNVISGNGHVGIAIYHVDGPVSSYIEMYNNKIGSDYFGTSAMPNGHFGITVNGESITIGSDAPGMQNIIAYNGTMGEGHQAGISVVGVSNQVTIAANQVHSNFGLGIDLADQGVLANDPGDTDAGPNDLQNYPVLNAAHNGVGPSTRVEFSLSSFLSGTAYQIRFFANDSCDSSGNGEGARLVGSVGFVAGGGTAQMFLTETVPNGDFITATATNANGSTSEFSACRIVTTP